MFTKHPATRFKSPVLRENMGAQLIHGGLFEDPRDRPVSSRTDPHTLSNCAPMPPKGGRGGTKCLPSVMDNVKWNF